MLSGGRRIGFYSSSPMPHYIALMDMLRWQLTSRAEFERLLAARADTLTDLERAARFLYLQHTAFGGRISGRNFDVSPGLPARFDTTKLAPVLEAAHERLAGAVIERLQFGEFIQRYDRPDTLFYLDPPYWACEADYGQGVFERADFERLAEQLAGIQDRFLLSINDRPEVRAIFAAFEIEAVSTSYTVARDKRPGERAGELLITGLAR